MTAANQWLTTRTGRDAAWWVAAVQQAVQESSSPSEDPNHDTSDVEAFLAKISHLVRTSLPSDGSYDPNMRAGATLALVTALWYGRLHSAKIHSPSRPINLRQRSYEQLVEWTLAIVSAIFDERMDAAFFPGQRWDFPFSFTAEDGSFI